MNIDDIIRKLTVKVSSKNATNLGSGIIYKDLKRNKYLIFTAKHCLVNEENKVDSNDITIHIKINQDDFENYPVEKVIISPKDDFGILVISSQTVAEIEEIIEVPIPTIKLANNSQRVKSNSKLKFRGFPKIENNEKAITVNATVNETVDGSSIFRIEPNSNLDTFKQGALKNSKGFSGSGVFIEYSNAIELAGIVQEIEGFSTIVCIYFPSKLDWLLGVNDDDKSIPKKKKTIQKTLISKEYNYPSFIPYQDIKNDNLQRIRQEVFPLISRGEAIVILGPNILASDDNYLSEKLLKDYCSSRKLSLEDYGVDNIIEFLDLFFSLEKNDRKDFDDFVVDFLQKTPPPYVYNFFPRIDWKAIITSNPDIFLEQEYDNQIKTTNQKLIPICHTKDFTSGTLRDEVNYIKLGGSINNRGTYKFIFSEDDFNRQKKFYKKVVDDLNTLSYRVPIIAFGFSLKDPLSKKILQQLKLKNTIYLVDNTIKEIQFNLLKIRKYCPIVTDVESFFKAYEQWENEGYATKNRRKKIFFKKRDNTPIGLTAKENYLLETNIRPLRTDDSSTFKNHITAKDFYEGQEPNFEVIFNSYDVIKIGTISKIQKKIIDELYNASENTIPIIFLTGSFGTGKTTFTLRIIHEIITNDEYNALAFEIIDTDKINIITFAELLRKSGATNIIIYINAIEQHSAYTGVFSFHRSLANEHLPNINILILSSIRINILERSSNSNQNSNIFSKINIDSPFNNYEASDYVEKLKDQQLVSYRDHIEKNKLIKQVINNYGGDSLVASFNLLKGGNHSSFLESAYNEVDDLTQKSFIYVSLLYRYKIKMPASLLKDILEVDWKTFVEKVVKIDGKGLLLYEINDNSTSFEPDMYFWTRHTTLSEALIKSKLRSDAALYKEYSKIIHCITHTSTYSKLLVNLLKAINKADDLQPIKLDKLYDIAYENFENDPHFVLHYAINLQRRKVDRKGNLTEDTYILKAIKALQYVQKNNSIFNRNHFILHRRGILAFYLVRYSYDRGKITDMWQRINEARDFFDLKKIYDPCSSYSYSNYLKLEIWLLNNLNLDATEVFEQIILIEALFDEANKTIFGSQDDIKSIEVKYRSTNPNINIPNETENSKNKLIEEPYYSIILYYQYVKDKKIEKAQKIIDTLEDYDFNDSVAIILFKHYGRHLYIPNFRIKFFKLLQNYPNLEKKDPLRYFYYNYIAMTYDSFHDEAYRFLTKIREQFSTRNLSPKIRETWQDSDGKNKLFTGIIVRRNDRIDGRKCVKIKSLQRKIPISKGLKQDINLYDSVEVIIHFHLAGPLAEIVSTKKDT